MPTNISIKGSTYASTVYSPRGQAPVGPSAALGFLARAQPSHVQRTAGAVDQHNGDIVGIAVVAYVSVRAAISRKCDRSLA